MLRIIDKLKSALRCKRFQMFRVTNRVHGSQGFGKLSPQHYREPPVNSQGPSEFLPMIGWGNVSGFERKGVYVTGQD